ncbi:hypothetical protein [Yoonia sp.]|uniref:hypothetical protein n=1 Tax=Yoonia sp. TaxID=2212373 RepID=UPI0019E73C2E|nr:hypothetical protein [Yoonia sp.]MBE0413243.1 hypothetical protein [Yoonia sp.]
MSDTHQILDVSYGTFSCRLEGFDDSVETMKTVVTFFHQLAGHDRFMDMAPQAPDLDALAEMTARKTGVSVQVEAETDAQRLNLHVRRSAADNLTEKPDLRIKPSVAPDHTAPLQETAAEDSEPADAVAPESNAKADEAGDIAPKDDMFDEEYEDEDAAPVVAMVQPALAQTDIAPAKAGRPSADTAESVAAKLQRIRAIVGRAATTGTHDTLVEDSTTDTDTDDIAPAANPLTQRLAELAQRHAAQSVIQKKAVSESTGAIRNAADAELQESDSVTEVDHTTDDHPASDTADAPANVAVTSSENVPDMTDDRIELSKQVAEVEQAIAMRREIKSKRDELPGNVDAAISRILSQADQRLNEPLGRRQRDAFAQLKAAVAATEAARQLGDPGTEAEDPGEAFRDDLDAQKAEDEEIVKNESKEASSPSPLRLVPSQRVDEPASKIERTADRLRQIAAQKDSEDSPNGDFAAFAADKGATELGDLLEAAAAYIAFVEGDEEFSRPQVMKKVQVASSDEITREDGLRCFGQLLRQNRIVKLNNGRFTVAKDTRFRPDERSV